MAPWSSSPQIEVQIRFKDEERSKTSSYAPMYVGSETVNGVATFNLRKDYEAMRYKIAVKGIVQTKITELPTGGLQSTSNTETQTFLSATLFEGPTPVVLDENKKHVARVPFKFNLANNHEDSSESFRSSDHAFQRLLPSVNSKTASKHCRWSSKFNSGPDAQYSVTYTIVATAASEKRKVFSASRPFSYAPSIIDNSPVALEDFPEEYVVRTTKAINKSSLSMSRIGMISQEPDVIALHPDSNTGETDIKLFLMLFRDSASAFGKNLSPRQARIKAELRTTSIVMDRPGTPAAHTIPGALKAGAVIKQEKSFAQECTIPLKQWHCADSESEEDQSVSSEEVLTNSLSVPFKISATRPLPPAFYSPLLSRRYAIDLALTFDDDNATTIKLRLPVQIGYEA